MIYLALLIHWLADFCLQTEQQANNKNHSFLALLYHVLTYGAVITVFFVLMAGEDPEKGLFLGVCNAVAHLVVDFCTSKLTHKLYEEKRYHDFFVVIGADQLIHTTCLAYTVRCIGGCL